MLPLDDPRLREAVGAMRDFPAPWCVAGGWAIDLFLGRVTRSHDDVEIAIFRQDQAELHRHLDGWTVSKVVNGQHLAWEREDCLAWPVHEIHARSLGISPCSLEFLLNERTGCEWVFRRHPSIRQPLEQWMLRNADGVPVLAPEIALLFKAKMPREKDEADYLAVWRQLDEPRRQWLAAAISQCHPDHPWLR